MVVPRTTTTHAERANLTVRARTAHRLAILLTELELNGRAGTARGEAATDAWHALDALERTARALKNTISARYTGATGAH